MRKEYLEGAMHECLVQVQCQAFLACPIWRGWTHFWHALWGVADRSVLQIGECCGRVRRIVTVETKRKKSRDMLLYFSERVR